MGSVQKKLVWGSFLKQAIGELHVERFGCTKAFIGQAPSKGQIEPFNLVIFCDTAEIINIFAN